MENTGVRRISCFTCVISVINSMTLTQRGLVNTTVESVPVTGVNEIGTSTPAGFYARPPAIGQFQTPAHAITVTGVDANGLTYSIDHFNEPWGNPTDTNDLLDLPAGTIIAFAAPDGDQAAFELRTATTIFESGSSGIQRIEFSNMNFIRGEQSVIGADGFLAITNLSGIPYLDLEVANADFPLPGSTIHVYEGITAGISVPLRNRILLTGGFLLPRAPLLDTTNRDAYQGSLVGEPATTTYWYDNTDDAWYDAGVDGNQLIGF